MMDAEEVFRRLVAVGWAYKGGVHYAPNRSFWLSHALIADLGPRGLLDALRERRARVERGELGVAIEDWWEGDLIDELLEKELHDVVGALDALEEYLGAVQTVGEVEKVKPAPPTNGRRSMGRNEVLQYAAPTFDD